MVAGGTLAAELLKPNAGADVLGTFDPKPIDGAGTGFVVFAVAPNVNMDGGLWPSKLGAELAVVLAANVPNPTLVLAASVGFVAGMPKLNVGGADGV